MKKLMKPLCSALCMMSITLPFNVLAMSAEETGDVQEELVEQATDNDWDYDEYHMAFLTGDFGLQVAKQLADKPIDTLILFVSDTNGRIVKDAQVVNTVINHAGEQQMSRALPYKGGYMVAVNHLPSGAYRLETEIVTDGQLLTDDFVFQKA